MLIYDALKKDHQKVKELLSDLLALDEDDSEACTSLIQEIRDELIPHARAEEAVFYNSLRSLKSARKMVVEGYQEHITAEALLRALQVADRMSVDWTKAAEKLKSVVEHHIEEEENEIIPAAEKLFQPEEAEMMGEAFERLKQEVKEEGFMQTTLELIANIMPSRLASTMRSYNLESRL